MTCGRDIFLTLLVALLCIAFLFTNAPIEYLQRQLTNMGFFSYVAFVLILVLAVVGMPLVVMPLIPVAAMTLGALPTALLSIVGWTLGGSIAFLIARYAGRPFLERHVSLQKLSEIEAKIPKKSHIWAVIILRMTLPVDLLSYALGFTKSLSFTSYFIGTLIGVSWFSFAFAYMGEALFTGDTQLLMKYLLPSIGIFFLALYMVHVQKRDK